MCNQMICAATWLTPARSGWLFTADSTSALSVSSSGRAALLMSSSCSSDVSTPTIILTFSQGTTVKMRGADFPGYFQEKMRRGILRVKHYYGGNVSLSYGKRCDLQNECPSDKRHCDELSTCTAIFSWHTPAELHFLPVQQVRVCGIPFSIQMRHSQNKLYEASKANLWCGAIKGKRSAHAPVKNCIVKYSLLTRS